MDGRETRETVLFNFGEAAGADLGGRSVSSKMPFCAWTYHSDHLIQHLG